MAKKKTEKKPKSMGEAVGFVNILSNEKVDFILGLLVLCFVIYMVIAMVSYFNTGQADQSILDDMRPGEWLNFSRQFTNYCGSLGAMLSYWLITVNFGFAAFLIPVFLLMVALWLMRAYKVSLLKWFACITVVMVWCSVTLAKFLTPFAGDLVFNPGGRHGLYCVDFLENLIGPPGLVVVLAITAITFLTYLSAETITIIRKMLNPVGYFTSKIQFTVNTPITNVNAGDDEDTSEDSNEDNPEDEVREVSRAMVVNLSPEEPTVATPVPDIEIEPAANDEPKGSTLTIEVPKGDETTQAKTLTADEIRKTPIDPREPFTRYKFPTLSLLKDHNAGKGNAVDMEEIKVNNAHIVEVLRYFDVSIDKINATVGPTVTLYEITPTPGTRIAKIRNLEDDIAMSLAAEGIRIIAPIPGKGTIGIEVPNKKKSTVSLESVLGVKKFKETKMELPMALGKTITNEVFMVDLAKLPHLLVAGATGMGKSVGLNVIINSLLYKKHPNELKFVLVDPKKVEFTPYNKIAQHFMACLPENDDEPIITNVQKVVRTLNSLCTLMDHRYDLLKAAGVNKIKDYNALYLNHRLNPNNGHEYMPYIVVIIDEFGDLIMTAGKEVELPIARIAQLARAVGIHMIIATQRPTTSIITGNIKANFPGRMAFRVGAQIDSRTILDRKGADQLIGMGDMLFLNGSEPVRVQCAFIDTEEINAINTYIEDQPGPVEPMELPEPVDVSQGEGASTPREPIADKDPMLNEVARYVVLNQQGSTSSIQRKFSIGYNRAGRIMDLLEQYGIVGAAQGSKPRQVLVNDENQLNSILSDK